MKKLLCAILAASMLLLCACGNLETSVNNAVEPTEQTETTEDLMQELFEEEEEPAAPNGETETAEEEAPPAFEDEETEEAAGEEYILNINSYKIHYPWCHSVDRMKEYNKKYVTDTVENLIDKGYSPCGNCKPY